MNVWNELKGRGTNVFSNLDLPPLGKSYSFSVALFYGTAECFEGYNILRLPIT